MGSFVFLVGPREAAEIVRRHSPAKYMPGWMLEKALTLASPIKLSKVAAVQSLYGRAGGWLMVIPLADGPGSHPVHFARACRMAKRLGAGVVGLEAFDLPGGNPRAGDCLELAVTAGNALTMAVTLEGLKLAASQMGHSLSKARVAVIGATSDPGRVYSLLLAREVKTMVLVGEEKRKLEDLAGRIYFDSGLSVRTTRHLKKALSLADIVISAYSGGSVFAGWEFLNPGSVYWDTTGCRSRSPGLNQTREDVLLVDGGIVEVPGEPGFCYRPGYPPGTTCPCMAETMLLAMEELRPGYTPVGEISLRQVNQMAALGKKHGLKLKGFKSMGRNLSPADIAEIRASALRKEIGAVV
ncbi:MAG: shikimate dehydrogenase [Desulfocucumaceae bacterium]